MNRFLNPDQIQRLKLKPKSARCLRWSNHTIKTCLQLRKATWKKGYSHLRKLGYPVPAYRTLCDRVVKAEFRPGLQSDVFWEAEHQDLVTVQCSLALYETQLRPCIDYDKFTSTNLKPEGYWRSIHGAIIQHCTIIYNSHTVYDESAANLPWWGAWSQSRRPGKPLQQGVRERRYASRHRCIP